MTDRDSSTGLERTACIIIIAKVSGEVSVPGPVVQSRRWKAHDFQRVCRYSVTVMFGFAVGCRQREVFEAAAAR